MPTGSVGHRMKRRAMLGLLPLAAALLFACGGGHPTGSPDAGASGPPDGSVSPVADGGSPDGGPVADGGESDGGHVDLVLKTITPPRGALEGGTIVVFAGKGFVDGFAQGGGLAASAETTVTFGGNPAVEVNVIDDDTIEVKSPPGTAGAADVTIANPNGSTTCAGCFTYFQAIGLSRLSPTQGSTRGGDTLTLTGAGFVPGVMVLVGGNAATNVSVSTDGTSLTAETPPGLAGSADVGVVGLNSSAFLHRAFVYVAPMSVTSVSPPDGPVAGGTAITVSGAGFSSDATVELGGVPATNVALQSDGTLVATAPAASLAGPVAVTVTTQWGQATLQNGFAYYDQSRALQLFTVTPRQGPTSGGSCAAGPSTCLELTGTGLAADGLAVRVGAADAHATVIDDHLVQVDLPPGPAGLVDVQARTVTGVASLPGAFAYVVPLSLSGIAPAEADASGAPATTATVEGSVLSASCRVWVGAGEATVTAVAPDGSSLTVTVPPGSPGVRDVRVACGDAASPGYQEATLAGAFTFTSPLSILQVTPSSGAIAGNSLVTLYGAGFQSGMEVDFGANKAPKVAVDSPLVARAWTPRGDVGMVDVTVKTSPAASATLKAGYSYLDPTNINGGGSGGPMLGTLNVTVLNSTPGMSGPVDGVAISINDDQLTGVTDDRGQVTFSDPSLLKAVTITGTKKDFAVATIAHIDARDVTLFMEMNAGGGSPSPPPPAPDPATFTGRVCGFKVQPGFTLKPGQDLEAHVYMSAPYVYAAPPFGTLADPIRVTTDCGTYALATRQYGALALYAEFGVADNSVSPPTFTPLLMGIKRGLAASPGEKADGLDIILDMHLDESIPITVEPAQKPPGQLVVNQVYSYLDLGGEGVVPLGQTQSTDDSFVFANHPRVDGDGLLFLNMAGVLDVTSGTVSPPYSFFYRRQYGDPQAGVQIGPMLAFTHLTAPASGGTFAGSLTWSFYDGDTPDVTQVNVAEPSGFSSKPIWDVVVPGSDLSVALPQSALASIDPGQQMFWTVITAKTPRFDYDQLGYQQLGVNAWTSFTEDYDTFTTP